MLSSIGRGDNVTETDQPSKLTRSWIVAIVTACVVTVVVVLSLVDYWVWTNVSYLATFEAIVAESNVALAVGAGFAIWSSSGEAKDTREVIFEIHREAMEARELYRKGVATETSPQPPPPPPPAAKP